MGSKHKSIGGASKTSHDKHRKYSLPRGSNQNQYKMTVNEMAKMGRKTTLGSGIEGYEVKLWNHDIEKPITYGIHNECGLRKKPRHYLDQYLRNKAIVPAPTAYNVSGDLTFKQNMCN